MKATIALLLRQVCSSAEQYGRACMKDWDLSPAQGFVLDHLLAQQGEACATELHRQFGIGFPDPAVEVAFVGMDALLLHRLDGGAFVDGG